jgi:hypothetical protein
MEINKILVAIEEQITRLKQARELLAENGVNGITKGKTKGSRRTVSEEGKARIAAAQKKRWAAFRKASNSK